MRRHERVTFKQYAQDQMLLLPPHLGELIPEDHPVRVVSRVMDSLSLAPLLARYKGGGTSSYDPRMMLKVLVYAYSQRLYSSRRIAKALRENVYFMWLAGGNKPDFRTINRFRGEILRGVMESVFAAVTDLLLEKGCVRLEDYFVDGTKIEANAGKYSYVWAKSTKRYKRQVKEKIHQLLREAEAENEAENAKYGDRDLDEMEGKEVTADDVERTVQEIEERLADKASRSARKAIRALRRDCIPRLRRYEQQENTLGARGSYSKTDHDATFMRMKERTVAGEPLKPAYNVQIGTENQFVLGYSLHQRPGDTGCLIPHLREWLRRWGHAPRRVITDAGYGSEENYAFLDGTGLGSYVKYNTFDREQKKRRRPTRFRPANWPYDAALDVYICPAGNRLTYKGIRTYTSANGYQSQSRVYEAHDCQGCALRPQCTRSQTNRRMQTSAKLQAYKRQAATNLNSPTGRTLRSRRLVEAEAVFGRLKHNWGFRRFLLRGIEKAETEWGILCMAHNLTRLATLSA